jgi:hypothetical protein
MGCRLHTVSYEIQNFPNITMVGVMLADTSGTAGRSTGQVMSAEWSEYWLVVMSGRLVGVWSEDWSVQRWALALAEWSAAMLGNWSEDCRRIRRGPVGVLVGVLVEW